ncbi:hypothetical protein D9M68_901500 [compost metagenome]
MRGLLKVRALASDSDIIVTAASTSAGAVFTFTGVISGNTMMKSRSFSMICGV